MTSRLDHALIKSINFDPAVHSLANKERSIKCTSHPQTGVTLYIDLRVNNLVMEMDHLIHLTSLVACHFAT